MNVEPSLNQRQGLLSIIASSRDRLAALYNRGSYAAVLPDFGSYSLVARLR